MSWYHSTLINTDRRPSRLIASCKRFSRRFSTSIFRAVLRNQGSGMNANEQCSLLRLIDHREEFCSTDVCWKGNKPSSQKDIPETLSRQKKENRLCHWLGRIRVSVLDIIHSRNLSPSFECATSRSSRNCRFVPTTDCLLIYRQE